MLPWLPAEPIQPLLIPNVPIEKYIHLTGMAINNNNNEADGSKMNSKSAPGGNKTVNKQGNSSNKPFAITGEGLSDMKKALEVTKLKNILNFYKFKF
jgi:hypothetical protein